MGAKHFVKFGLYIVKGAINVQLAEKTGFTEEDAEVVKKAIATMFVNDDYDISVDELYGLDYEDVKGVC